MMLVWRQWAAFDFDRSPAQWLFMSHIYRFHPSKKVPLSANNCWILLSTMSVRHIVYFMRLASKNRAKRVQSVKGQWLRYPLFIRRTIGYSLVLQWKWRMSPSTRAGTDFIEPRTVVAQYHSMGCLREDIVQRNSLNSTDLVEHWLKAPGKLPQYIWSIFSRMGLRRSR